MLLGVQTGSRGTWRLARPSSGEAGAVLGHPAQSSAERAGQRRCLLPGARWERVPRPDPPGPQPGGRRREVEAAPRATLTPCEAATFDSGPASSPLRCAQEGIQKGLSRERLRAGCGNGIKAYANRPSSAFLHPSELEPVSRKMLLLQTLNSSPSPGWPRGGPSAVVKPKTPGREPRQRGGRGGQRGVAE